MIIKEAGVETVKWADYEAAYAEFQRLRKALIKDIMQMEIKEGTDYYSMLQNKIKEFKEGEPLKRAARSVVTGELLEKTSKKYIEQNVVDLS